MSNQNFKIKNGLTIGNSQIIDSSGNISLPQGASITIGGSALQTSVSWNDITDIPENVINKDTIIATAGQTVFPITYAVGTVDVYLNGIKLTEDIDYTATDGANVVLTDAAAQDDIVSLFALSGLTTYLDANVYTKAEVDSIVTNLPPGYSDTDVSAYLSTHDYATVTQTVASIVDTAPSTLNTLNELAAALGDDPNFATTISNQIGSKWTQDNGKISNWDASYSWGNHANAGYLNYTTLSDGTGHGFKVGPHLSYFSIQTEGTTSGVYFNDSMGFLKANYTPMLYWDSSKVTIKNASFGDAITFTPNTGSVTATTYIGDGSQLTGVAKESTTYTKTEVNTSLALKANTSSLSTVATSGSYNDLSNKPTLGSLAALDSISASTLTGSTLATGVTSSSLTSVGTLSSLRVTGLSSLGTNTYTKSSFGNGDLALDNGTNDTPATLFYYANNKNWGIDSWYDPGASKQILRFVTDLNEAGGAVRASLDDTGKFTASSFAGNGSALTNIGASAISDGAVTASKLGSNALFLTQFAARTSQHSLGGDSGWVDHLSMTFTTNRVCNCLFMYSSSASYESGAVQGFARLILDGTMVGWNSAVAKQSTANSAGAGTCIWDKQNVSAGTHTITVQVRNIAGGTTWITPYWSADGQTANTLGVLYYGG